MVTTTISSLYRAIRENPDDDVPRLMLADELDGLDTVSVPCRECKGKGEIRGDGIFSTGKPCLACGGKVLTPHSHRKGTGTVPDTSNADRAEIIRVQVELSRELADIQPHHHDNLDMILDPDSREDQEWKHRVRGLQKRVKELLAANSERWRRGPRCGECSGGDAGMLAECPDCWGTGDAGGLMRRLCYSENDFQGRDELVRVTYHRGMKRIECRGEDVWREVIDLQPKGGVLYPKPQGQPTPWAVAVCAAHPDVISLWLTDVNPVGTPRGYYIHPDGVPSDVHRATMANVKDQFETREQASTTLSQEVVKWVHTFIK